MSENSQPLDLLGDPIPEPMDRRGRPGYDVTDESRIKVKGLRAMGHPIEFIAMAVGCCEKTLRNYFILELDEGAAMLTGDVVFKLYQRGVVDGNVSALGKLAGMLAPSNPSLPDPTRPANTKPKPEKLGKKDQALVDAKNAHENTGWFELVEPESDHGPN
ncbi:hypothetical protein [Maritalea sp.]|uniref:hypothetical protein n=1 Tax=Maritalea sp. TaxID=2003361 RepID=UPI003EF502CA